MSRCFRWIAMLLAMFLLNIEGAGAQRTPAAPQALGFAAKRPVIGGACATCPWGALAVIVRDIMQPAGYDVQVCSNCNRVDSPLFVSERRRPPPVTPHDRELGAGDQPNGPVDFGVTNVHRLADAYFGRDDYARDGPQKNLRAVAVIEHPSYLVVAAKSGVPITSLADIRTKRLPLRILSDGTPLAKRLLAEYGISEASMKSWGGEILPRGGLQNVGLDRSGFEVIVWGGYLANTPESNVWYEMSQKDALRFLNIDEPILGKLATEFEQERGALPLGYFRGVDRPIPTVVQSGQVIYGRDDMPDSFAYDLAKWLDTSKRRFIFSHIAFSYNPDTVWQTYGVPLHPAAIRYYRERGYMR